MLTFETLGRGNWNTDSWKKAEEIYHEAFGENERKSEKQILNLVQHGTYFLHLVRDVGEIVAFSLTGDLFDVNALLIDYIATRKAIQSKGLGRQLVSYIKEWAENHSSLGGILLEAEADLEEKPLDHPNVRRINFWTSCGFSPSNDVYCYRSQPEPYMWVSLSFKGKTMNLPENSQLLFQMVREFHKSSHISPKTFPLKKQVKRLTSDSDSFKDVDYGVETEIPMNRYDAEGTPLQTHVGAFSAKRRMHTHEGVDLYCELHDEVFAMEGGKIVNIETFTGPNARVPSEWWNETFSILVEGESGVIVYGELIPVEGLSVGDEVKQGQLIGRVTPVLKKDKGRPMIMLHLELHKHGFTDTVEWGVDADKPESMKDPTLLLITAKNNIPA